MEIRGKVWCLFEQSGTFKNEFKKLGYEAVDVDIQNNFGETDYQIDLFAEIENAYDGKPSLFDQIRGQDADLVLAFFPCIYFCENNQLYFCGRHHNLSKLSLNEKANIILERSRNRQYLYELCLKMFIVCEQKGIRLIVENPYASQHYLVENFPYKASIIDKDRTRRGDYFKKPTQYWFVNCLPTHGYSPQETSEHRKVSSSKSGIKAGICSEERSMISPDYARNFICDFILGKQQENTLLTLFDMETPRFDTQRAKVREYLLEGKTITSWKAIELFRCTRLSAVIYSLIHDYDMPIMSKMVYEDDGTRYAKYWLTADPVLRDEIKDFMLRGNKISEESAREIFGVENLAVLLNDLREDGVNVRSEVYKPLCGKSFTRWFIS